MPKKRSMAIFAVAFAAVLLGGAALAAVGTMPETDSQSESFAIFGDGDGLPTLELVEAEEPAQEPKDEPTEEPKDEPAAEPKDEPAAEPKDEPAAEPKDEPAAEPKDEPAEEPKEEEPVEKDTTPPHFAILWPEEGAHVEREVIAFEGSVEPEATVVRGRYEAHVEGDGWRLELVLSPGENTVWFLARDAAGNESKDSVTVYYDVHDGGGDEKPDTVEFSAHQKYGSCGEEIPYDVFHGTATPGTTIWVESPYGGGTTTAGDDGRWDIRVTFPEAPPGEEFHVVIETSEGDRAVFAFVNTGGEHTEG